MSNFKFIILLGILVTYYNSAFTQINIKSDISFNNAGLKDTVGNMKFSRLSLGLSATLYKSYNIEKEQYHSLMFSINNSFSRFSYSPDFTSQDNIGIQSGLTYLYNGNQKNTFIISILPFISSEISEIEHSNISWLTLALYDRKVNSNWNYNLGLIYLKTIKNQLILPIIGFNYNFNDFNKIDVKLPFKIQYTHIHNQTNSSVINLGFNGFHSEINQVDNTNAIITLRQLIISYSFEQKIKNAFKWFARIGLTTGSNVNFSNFTENYPERQLKSGLLIQAGIKYTFAKTQKFSNFEVPDIFNIQNFFDKDN
jgi:hypothetical protein